MAFTDFFQYGLSLPSHKTYSFQKITTKKLNSLTKIFQITKVQISVHLSVLRSTDACWCARVSYRPSNTTAIRHPKRPRSQRVFKWRLVHSLVDSYRVYLDRLRQDDIYCQTFLLPSISPPRFIL